MQLREAITGFRGSRRSPHFILKTTSPGHHKRQPSASRGNCRPPHLISTLLHSSSYFILDTTSFPTLLHLHIVRGNRRPQGNHRPDHTALSMPYLMPQLSYSEIRITTQLTRSSLWISVNLGLGESWTSVKFGASECCKIIYK